VKTLARIGAVPLLRAKPVGTNNEYAVTCEALPGEAFQSNTDMGRQARRAAYVKPELDRRRNLVDVLTTGPGCTYELLLQLGVWNEDGILGRHNTIVARVAVACLDMRKQAANPAACPLDAVNDKAWR